MRMVGMSILLRTPLLNTCPFSSNIHQSNQPKYHGESVWDCFPYLIQMHNIRNKSHQYINFYDLIQEHNLRKKKFTNTFTFMTSCFHNTAQSLLQFNFQKVTLTTKLSFLCFFNRCSSFIVYLTHMLINPLSLNVPFFNFNHSAFRVLN